MPRFANADAPWSSPDFLWLAGLLEAEGTFLRPPPSSPRSPVVACRMTDRDVIERVADRLGTSIMAVDKGKYRTEYGACARGSRAACLMSDLRPFLGTRRRAAIDRALAQYVPPQNKLSYELAEEIRRRHASPESVSSLARSFGVARQTVHRVLKHEIYWAPPPRPWCDPVSPLPQPGWVPEGISRDELYWLAGWLEGEGSFVAPPPSNPRHPRIAAMCCDLDVMEEVGRLLNVTPSRRPGRNGWSPTWHVTKVGSRAIELARAIQPMMSHRRSVQITHAIDAGERAVLGDKKRPSRSTARVEAAGIEPAFSVSMRRRLQV
jgi:hypothetical protein